MTFPADERPLGLAWRWLQQEGDPRDCRLRKRCEGTHHLVAATAVAAKLCHIAWRILTDRRDFLPQQPDTKT